MVPCNCCRSLECPNMHWLLGRAGYQICKQVPGLGTPWTLDQPGLVGGWSLAMPQSRMTPSGPIKVGQFFFFLKNLPIYPSGRLKTWPWDQVQSINIGSKQSRGASDCTESQILTVSSMDDNDPQWTSGPLSAKWEGDDIASRCFLNLNLG